MTESWTAHLFASIDYLGPGEDGTTEECWFHREVRLPFIPMKGMNLYLGFEKTDEGETPRADIVSVNWDCFSMWLWCHVAIFAMCDFRRIEDGYNLAVDWYERHNWQPIGPTLPGSHLELRGMLKGKPIGVGDG